jgi:RNA polymerase sigma-70 factor (ECF subfamily)
MKTAAIGFRSPSGIGVVLGEEDPCADLSARLPAVLSVIYLIFNELLAELMPNESEVRGLLSLMELQASREATRTDAHGDLVLLADQDRSRWDRSRIARGLTYLNRAGRLESRGPYQIQAAIAACHARAESWEATDWPAIVIHYAALAEISPSPVVDLNRAVAIGLAEGPAAGLAALDAVDASALRVYHLLPGARADFLRRLGRRMDAAAEYRRALSLTSNARERRFYTARLLACEEEATSR